MSQTKAWNSSIGGDWTNGLTPPARWGMPSCFRVVRDGEHEVLEHVNNSDRSLVAGQALWGDYEVEAWIRQLGILTQPSSDDPHAVIGRSGLLLRYQDLRQYYFFGMEGCERFVLYRRKDESWTMLADLVSGIDRRRYYHLRAECRANRFACLIDGKPAFVVYDDQLPLGKVGLRTNTRSRTYGVRITTRDSSHAAYVRRQSAYDREVAEASEKYPKPMLWKRINISAYWPSQVRFGDFRGAGRKEIVLQQQTDEGPRVVCLDFGGQVQWDKHYPQAARLHQMVVHDLDGDGAEDFIGIDQDRLRVVNGRTGQVSAETALPKTGPYRGHRGTSMGRYLHSLRVLWPCRIRKTDKAQDLILRDGNGGGSGYSIWAYDENLNLRWRQDAHNAWYGMYLWFYDVDGDGRDEILTGYDLYDGDGKHLWSMEGAEYIEDPGGGGGTWIMPLSVSWTAMRPTVPRSASAGSDPGFFLVDARTGSVLRHHQFGHVQGIYAGNFRQDLPGLEMWMGDRWGTYGILNLVSGQGEPLGRFEPDNISQGEPAVNWSGDGEELLYISSSPQAFGLYDAKARKVVKPISEAVPVQWGTAIVEDVVGDARDELTYLHEGELYIITQDRPFPKGQRIYAPTRRMDISIPGWRTG